MSATLSPENLPGVALLRAFQYGALPAPPFCAETCAISRPNSVRAAPEKSR